MSRSIVHGTYSTYFWHMCRCTECREGQRQRVARNRAERLASGSLSHGTRSAYDAGCRCEPCKDVRREVYARLDRWNA